MKGRHIHKFFHWVIMTLLLTFPILMVGISTFGKESQTIDVTETYEYETNDVNSIDDLVVGNIYKASVDLTLITGNTTNLLSATAVYFVPIQNDNLLSCKFNDAFKLNYNPSSQVFDGTHYTQGYRYFVYYYVVAQEIDFYFVYYNGAINENVNYSASDYLGEKNVDYVIHNEDYKQDVNNWINGFLNLPINAWYQSLMNVIGVGFTNSTVMNVIYVMPVYIIWVFIFDLLVDCFFVLIRLPHKLLNRLSGGENE